MDYITQSLTNAIATAMDTNSYSNISANQWVPALVDQWLDEELTEQEYLAIHPEHKKVLGVTFEFVPEGERQRRLFFVQASANNRNIPQERRIEELKAKAIHLYVKEKIRRDDEDKEEKRRKELGWWQLSPTELFIAKHITKIMLGAVIALTLVGGLFFLLTPSDSEE